MRRSSQRADMVCELSERSGATRSQPPSPYCSSHRAQNTSSVLKYTSNTEYTGTILNTLVQYRHMHIKCSQIYVKYNTYVQHRHVVTHYYKQTICDRHFWSLQIHTHTHTIGVSCPQHAFAMVHLSNIRHMDWIICGNLEIRTSLPQIESMRHVMRKISGSHVKGEEKII